MTKTLKALALAASLSFAATAADAALFTFSFDNVEGTLVGTVAGTIELPDGDGISLAATSVLITSAPAGLGYDPTSIDWVTGGLGPAFNSFTVSGGSLTDAFFVGAFNIPDTFFALSPPLFGGSFLNSLGGFGSGAPVQDSGNATLTFGSATAVPLPATGALLLAGVAGFAAMRRARK